MQKKVLVAFALLSSLSLCNVAYAKEERKAISKIKLDISYDVETEGKEKYISDLRVESVGDEDYSVDDFWVANEADDGAWENCDSPSVIIELSTDGDDYYFNKTTSGYFDLDGDADAEFISCKRDSDKSSLELMVSLKPINGTVGNPSNLTWSTDGKASWRKSYGASNYEVKLYKGNTLIASYDNLGKTATSYDFRKDIKNNGVGTYHFEVRANKGSKDSIWVSSYEYEITSDIHKNINPDVKLTDGNGPGGPSPSKELGNNERPVGPSGERMSEDQKKNLNGPGESGLVKGWIRDERGWWYRNPDDSWTKNNWQYINDKWYYFDEVGYMKTGWLQLGNDWYYLDTTGDGKMMTGWILDNNKWYYLGADGKMWTGEVYVNNKKYFLENSYSRPNKSFGQMYCNEYTPDNRWASEDGSIH